MTGGVVAGPPDRRPVGPDRGPVELEIALVAALSAVACLVYSGFYGGWEYAPVVVGAAVVPAVAVAVAQRRPWSAPGPRAGGLALAAGALYAVEAVYRPETRSGLPVPAAWSALGRGLTGGWAHMLTVGLPADPRGDLLVTPVALACLAATGGALLVARTASPLAPVGPAAVAFVVGLGLVAAAGGPHLAVTAVFLAVAATLVLVRAGRLAAAGVEHLRPDGAVEVGEPAPPAAGTRRADARRADARRGGGRRGRRHLAFGPPTVGALAVAGPLLAWALPVAGDDRFDPRALRDEVVEIDGALSPLVGVKAQLRSSPADELFHLEVDDLPAGVDRIGVAALDSYDGAQWSTTAAYRLAGDDLPADPLRVGPDVAGTEVRQHITVSDLDGPFLPALGRPVTVEGDDLGFDSRSGTLATGKARLTGTEYDVVSEVAPLTLVDDADDLAGLRAAAAPVLDAYRTPPPEVPPELRNLALAWASEADTHAGELLAIRDELRRLRYDQSSDAPPGHSYGALLRMLTGEPGEREGYSEQFAAAYALLARERGYATRVVVGYLLPPPDAGGGFTVTEAQAHAWPEVALEGLGWVAVEPTDLSRIGQTDAEADDVPEVPPDAPGEEGEQIDATEPRVVVDESGEPTGGGARVVRRGLAVGGIALVAGVLSLPLVAALVKAGRRRRRRTAPSTAAQVVGAWQETVDRLTGQGVQVDAAHTPPEVVAGVAARFDGALGSLHPLAALVSLAIYGPDEPPGEAAARAWALERSARGELAAVTGRPRQALAWVDPRPLLPTGRR